jgi:hypothetical protein
MRYRNKEYNLLDRWDRTAFAACEYLSASSENESDPEPENESDPEPDPEPTSVHHSN